VSLLLTLASVSAAAQSNEAVRTLAQREKQPLLDTLKTLVEIESGSADIEGGTRIGTLIAERLRELGGSVDLVPPAADRLRITSLPQQFADTVVARFHGRGSARILLLAAEHDVVLSFEGPGQDESIRLATSGIQLAVLTMTGRASHAGNAPDQGRNALYELSHQLLQPRDLSEPARAVKLNWTLANSGSVYNSIPAAAMAIGDMRADAPGDFEAVEAAIRERIRNRLIPDTAIDVRFETVFPPMPFAPASLPLAEHVQRLYAEAGGAAKINISSIEPRLHLLTRLIMDIAAGTAGVAAPAARRVGLP